LPGKDAIFSQYMFKSMIFPVLVGGLAIVIIWTTLSLVFRSQNLRVVVCDVGQGDGILLIYKSYQVLIDAGPDEAILKCLWQKIPWWDRHLELVVATHQHADHIGGFSQVFDTFSVGQIWSHRSSEKSELSGEFRLKAQALETNGTLNISPQVGQKFSLDKQVVITVISPPESFITEHTQKTSNDLEKRADFNENNLSIALFVQFHHFSLILTGDMESTAEQAVLGARLIKDTTVLKVAHHGSKTSTSDLFLEKSAPEMALISVGRNNKYNHPDTSVLDRLDKFGSEVLRTDQLGNFEVITDGQRYWVGLLPPFLRPNSAESLH
jgi:competence protein ComEC